MDEAGNLADAAWMAGMIRLRREELDRAKAHFQHALAKLDDLGALFAKYELMTIPAFVIPAHLDIELRYV